MLTVERSLNIDSGLLITTHGVEAVLLRQIDYKQWDGKTKIFPEGSTVFVDIDKNIGYSDGDHFEIFDEEYRVVNQN